MTRFAAALWNDDAGFVVSSELAMVGTLGVVGMVVGMSEVAQNVNQEMDDIGNAVGQLDQTFAVAGMRGHRAFVGGSGFLDRHDCGDDDLETFTHRTGSAYVSLGSCGNAGYGGGFGLSGCGNGLRGNGFGGLGGPFEGRQVVRNGGARYQRTVFFGQRDETSACIAAAPCPPAEVFVPPAPHVMVLPPVSGVPVCPPATAPCESAVTCEPAVVTPCE